MTICAVIITQNEERNIGRCLRSLEGVADEVVVVDSGSSDGTEQICLEAGVRFERHKWEGFSEQKNYANSLATSEWILSIDADEELSEELRKSILEIKSKEPADNIVFSFNRMTNYCGHWIRHCGWYPDWCCRMWRKGVARWEGLIHEELRFEGEVRHEQIVGDLYHYSYYTVSEHLQKQSKYAALCAREYYEKGKRCSAAAIVLRPMWTFVRNYFFRGGILDGWAGYTVCRIGAMYTLTKYAELYRREKCDASIIN